MYEEGPFYGLFGHHPSLSVHDLEYAREVHAISQGQGQASSLADDPRVVHFDTPFDADPHDRLLGLPLSRIRSDMSDLPRLNVDLHKQGTWGGVVFPTLEFMWSVIL